ncbi:UNVERIFIED_CONTAM: hypothetical protein HHA_231215 [Hammondia hammondi]|eukprot:XP_008885710.1 hypothetical protein HHA_231215 [Hammondia hammondi]
MPALRDNDTFALLTFLQNPTKKISAKNSWSEAPPPKRAREKVWKTPTASGRSSPQQFGRSAYTRGKPGKNAVAGDADTASMASFASRALDTREFPQELRPLSAERSTVNLVRFALSRRFFPCRLAGPSPRSLGAVLPCLTALEAAPQLYVHLNCQEHLEKGERGKKMIFSF